MGRPFKPIPEGKPGKELADYLRSVLTSASVTTYNVGRHAHCKHHAVSQNLDGRLPGWHVVENLLRGLRAAAAVKGHADRVPRELEETAYRLWADAKAGEAFRREEARMPAVLLQEQTDIAARGTHMSPETVELLNSITRASTPAPASSPPPRPPMRRQVGPHLTGDATVDQLVDRLNDVVQAAGIDITTLVRRSTEFPGSTGVTAQEARDVLTGRKPPSVATIREIVAGCGATPGEQDEWEAAVRRAVTGPATAAADNEQAPLAGGTRYGRIPGQGPRSANGKHRRTEETIKRWPAWLSRVTGRPGRRPEGAVRA